MMIEEARLELENVTVAYNGRPALQEVTFQVPHGAQVAVVGANGAGKSTLFKALVGLLPVRGGRILIHGQPLGSHHDCVAYVPQREDVEWRFPVTVEDVVMMGRFRRQGWLKRAIAAGPRRGSQQPGANGDRPAGEALDRRALWRAAAARLPGAGAGSGTAHPADG